MDLVGLDVIDFIALAANAETGDGADKPDPQAVALVAEGQISRKSGVSFYRYE